MASRLYVLVPLSFGVAISWMAAAVLYLHTRHASVFLAMVCLFAVCGYGLRTWAGMKERVFVSVLVGGILAPILRPAATGRFRLETLADLSSPLCPFLGVTYAIVFASIFILTFAFLCPRRQNDDPNNSKTTDEAL